MNREDAELVFGLDPTAIGKSNRGWNVNSDGILCVMTKDNIDGWRKGRVLTMPTDEMGRDIVTRERYPNFLWISGDIIDKNIIYYWFHPLSVSGEELKSLMLKHAKRDKK